VVHVVAGAATAAPIEDLSDADIEAQYDGIVRAALSALQAGRAEGATRFVFVIPSIAERGASGFATTCAAAEAVRVLALSAARQWNDEGVTVNCLRVASEDDDIAPLVEFLSSGSVNGETFRAGGPPRGL
jgi:NAD(P)-dependent dehydrogenase (short-subunit alcohol dehydrogenase family)